MVKNNSIVKLKIQIFNKAVLEFNYVDWHKKIVDIIIFFGGITRATKFFSSGKIVKNSWLKNIYYDKFQEKISKKQMFETIFESLYSYNDDLRKLIIYFFILKFKGKIEKITKKIDIPKEEIIQKINELGLSLPKSNPMKIMLYKKSKKGFITYKDINKIASELGCTIQNVRINVKKMNINYKSDSKLKKERWKADFEKQMNYFKINKFIHFKDKYWINKGGEIFKTTRKKIRKIIPILRRNQHGYNYSIISVKSKQYHLHKLIAELFIPNPKKYKYVRAIDEDPSNIDTKNLEWIKYPAVSRVINKITKQDTSWLNFVIKNINVGSSFSKICNKLAEIANKENFFARNKNKKSTIETIIKNYSQLNPVFPIFNIDKDAGKKVYVNYELLKKIKQTKSLLS